MSDKQVHGFSLFEIVSLIRQEIKASQVGNVKKTKASRCNFNGCPIGRINRPPSYLIPIVANRVAYPV